MSQKPIQRSFTRRDFVQQSSLLALAATAAPLVSGAAAPCRRSSLTDLTATEAVTALRNGDIKAEEYAQALLSRAQKLSALNAFITLRPQDVLQAARAADQLRARGGRLGRLHGLPIAVKDSIDTKSLPTSNGTRALKGFMPKADAAVVRPLLAEGAIVMGKTNLHELSCGWTSNNATFGTGPEPLRSNAYSRWQQWRLRCGGGGAVRSHCHWRGHVRLDPRTVDVLRPRRLAADFRALFGPRD